MGGRDARRVALQPAEGLVVGEKHRKQLGQHEGRLPAGDDPEGDRGHQEAAGQDQPEQREAAGRPVRAEQEPARGGGENRDRTPGDRRPAEGRAGRDMRREQFDHGEDPDRRAAGKDAEGAGREKVDRTSPAARVGRSVRSVFVLT